MTPVAALWQSHVVSTEPYSVAPDGCRDLILKRVPGARPIWLITDLDRTTFKGAAPVGTRFDGWRLRPGTRIDTARLLGTLQERRGASRVEELLADLTWGDPTLDEALAALSVAPDVASAARWAGLGLRSFQRCVSAGTGQPPVWWSRLGRARRAAHALESQAPAEVAADTGYADQSHMTREIRGFFGVTPAAIRAGRGPSIYQGYAV